MLQLIVDFLIGGCLGGCLGGYIGGVLGFIVGLLVGLITGLTHILERDDAIRVGFEVWGGFAAIGALLGAIIGGIFLACCANTQPKKTPQSSV